MPAAPATLLTSLYGDAVGSRLLPRFEAALARWRLLASPGHGTASPPPLTQRDCLLITYGDQILDPAMSPLQALGAFAERHWSGVVSGLHILPFYPSSSDDGFSVEDYSEVDPALGTWTDVRRIGEHFDLMVDAVFNHLSARSRWFSRFIADDPAYRDFFVTVDGDPDLSQVIRPRALPLLTAFSTVGGTRNVWTTFSADQVDLNFRNPEVLFAVLEALVGYVTQGARYIRLDAIAFLWKEIGTSCLHLPQTHQLIQLMRAVLVEIAPDVRLITETNVPHAENVSYFGDGTNEAHLVYNFALPPLVLHSLATGNASRLTQWARTLVLPSDQVTFFNFLASHDGIGINPARGVLTAAEIEALVARTLSHGGLVSYRHLPDGSRTPYEMNINFFDALSDPAGGELLAIQVRRTLCAHAILMSLAGVPAIYVHSLMGSRGDRAGADASGIPRRINREKLDRCRLETELADPDSLRHHVFSGLKSLLQARRGNPAFAPSAPQKIWELGESVFAVERLNPNGADRVLCLHNISNRHVEVTRPDTGLTVGLDPYQYRWLQTSE